MSPGDERLIKAIHVSQLEKKKKTYFLCLSVSKDKSGFISTVKKLDKDNYKKKRTWGLQDLRMVDGKDGKRVCSCRYYLIKYYSILLSKDESFHYCNPISEQLTDWE